MTIIKRGQRYKAILKSGREYVGSKTFDTKREARDWLTRERAALVGGIDPRAGRQRVRTLVTEWLALRRTTVAKKTYRADSALPRLMPPSLQALQVGAVSQREVARSFDRLIRRGLTEGSVVRYRASLSAFFEWCVREKLIQANPVSGTSVPKSSDEQVEMFPWDESGLELAYTNWRRQNVHLADVFLILGWTGLRWAEARDLTVGALMEVPTPTFLVRHSQPEGVERKATKGRRSRRVPIADRVLPLVRQLAEGREAHDLLLTAPRGGRLHRTPSLRALDWKTTGAGRRIHDLRHTAACLWLVRGVDVPTVQAWMGHESIATTNRYVHYLGTSADVAGLEKLNKSRPGYLGGTSESDGSESHG